ncbi:MAG: hypothetical protein U0521_22650 [Anaerolineae bacterium]
MNTIHSSLTTAVSSQKSYRADTHAKPHTAQREDPTTIAIVSPSRLLHEGLATALGRYLNVVVVAGYDGDVVPDDADDAAQITLLDRPGTRARLFVADLLARAAHASSGAGACPMIPASSWITYRRARRRTAPVRRRPGSGDGDPGARDTQAVPA